MGGERWPCRRRHGGTWIPRQGARKMGIGAAASSSPCLRVCTDCADPPVQTLNPGAFCALSSPMRTVSRLLCSGSLPNGVFPASAFQPRQALDQAFAQRGPAQTTTTSAPGANVAHAPQFPIPLPSPLGPRRHLPLLCTPLPSSSPPTARVIALLPLLQFLRYPYLLFIPLNL